MDEMEKVELMLEEHTAIRHYMNAAEKSLQELETIYRQKGGEWNSEQLRVLEQKRVDFQQAVSSLKDGIRDHYTREEYFLRPLLGEYLMKAIIKEEKQIDNKLCKVEALVNNANKDNLNSEQMLIVSSQVKQAIDKLRRSVDLQSLKMDTILHMLKEVLKPENKNRRKKNFSGIKR